MEWGAWDEGSDTVEILYTVWRNQSTNQARNQARNRVGNVCSYPYTREIRSVNSVHIRILSVNSEISRGMIRNHSLISKSYFRALCRTPRHETYLYLNLLLLSPFIFLLLPISSFYKGIMPFYSLLIHTNECRVCNGAYRQLSVVQRCWRWRSMTMKLLAVTGTYTTSNLILTFNKSLQDGIMQNKVILALESLSLCFWYALP